MDGWLVLSLAYFIFNHMDSYLNDWSFHFHIKSYYFHSLLFHFHFVFIIFPINWCTQVRKSETGRDILSGGFLIKMMRPGATCQMTNLMIQPIFFFAFQINRNSVIPKNMLMGAHHLMFRVRPNGLKEFGYHATARNLWLSLTLAN